MSAYSEIQTQFKDGEALIEALQEMGFKPQNHIGSPMPLVGYQGDYRTADGEGHTRDITQAMKADIILPRAQVGVSSNDIGFVKGPDGTFGAIISEYDSTKHNTAWLNKVRVNYTAKMVQKQAKRAGLRQVGEGKMVNGKMQYIFLKA